MKKKNVLLQKCINHQKSNNIMSVVICTADAINFDMIKLKYKCKLKIIYKLYIDRRWIMSKVII